MNIKFNIKGVIYGVIILFMIIGGFIFIPKMFMGKAQPIDYTMIERDAIPEKILAMMDKYVDQERALVVKLDNKIYVVVTKGQDSEHGIQIDKITTSIEDDKQVMNVVATYKNKEESHPYIVAETNLNELPDRIELETSVEGK
ncbi:MAG: hypothetical protein RSD22_01420 [Romboutsia sp.]